MLPVQRLSAFAAPPSIKPSKAAVVRNAFLLLERLACREVLMSAMGGKRTLRDGSGAHPFHLAQQCAKVGARLLGRPARTVERANSILHIVERWVDDVHANEVINLAICRRPCQRPPQQIRHLFWRPFSGLP